MDFTPIRLALAVLLASVGPALAGETARGRVYHDLNQNQKFDAGERLLPGIKVSNGREIVVTDGNGAYELPVDDDTIVFVIKPRGWRTPLNADNLPQFFYIHKPAGSADAKFPGVEPTGPLPDSIDFPLYPHQEPEQFRAVLFGDPQPRNQKEVDFIAHDIVEELIGTDASFGVTLGDIVFDDLSVFKPLNQTIALIGIPWYNVIGNHDINLDAKDDSQSDETFERTYGPSYYSFNHGPVHFLVLDNVEWFIPEGRDRGKYQGGLGEDQIQFIKSDLAMIPDDQLVVLMMHIPLEAVRDRHELYRLIEQRPFCVSISAHFHRHIHRFIGKEDGWMGPQRHHHIINVTVSGSWWSGAPDERGIPHTLMSDGAPNGYSIISFDGTDYKLDFKAAGRPADYQLEITAPEVVSQAELPATEVYANVFNGSERTKVEMRFGDAGAWVEMERFDGVSPKYRRAYQVENALDNKQFRDLPAPTPSSHLWRAKLPSSVGTGTHLLSVRATDMHGRTHQSGRIVRVVADAPGAVPATSGP